MSVFPKMAKIKIHYEAPDIDDVAGELLKKLHESKVAVKKESKIGIAVGSRGIHKLQDMIVQLVHFFQDQGAKPVIIPAMGSHGGATAAGQRRILAEYGITEKEISVPIAAGMETVRVGYIRENIPVYFDKIACQMDGIVLINRIKSHTDFHGAYESGLMKQMTIGLGNHNGAQNIHSYSVEDLKWLLPESAQLILKKMPVIMGVAILENYKGSTADINILKAEEIAKKEPQLLRRAKSIMPRLPFREIDLLVVEEIGKNINGVGMDPNVTGRRFIRNSTEEEHIKVSRIVCLNVTPESHGNAQGVGIADVIPRRVYNTIDFNSMYVNVITNRVLERAFIPIIQESDYAAMELALKCCGRKIAPVNSRVVQIKNTLHLDEMYVSMPLLAEIDKDCIWNKMGEFTYTFTEEGDLINLIGKPK